MRATGTSSWQIDTSALRRIGATVPNIGAKSFFPWPSSRAVRHVEGCQSRSPETVIVSDPLLLRWIDGWVAAIFVGVADVTFAGVGPTVERDGTAEAVDVLVEVAGRGTAVSSGGGVVAHPLAMSPVTKAATAHSRRGNTI